MSTRTFWGAAAISSVIVSWFFYRALVPQSWKEWTRAGVVQAFIIAFWDGNLWIYLTGTPAAMLVSMIIGYSIALFGIALVTAGWREVYRARKEHRLATQGPYAFMRHPQYTGFFLVMFGEGVVHWPTVFSLAAFPIVVIAYSLLARKEEREMAARFGDEYREYRRRVPMFLPARWHWRGVLQLATTPTS